MVFSSLIFLWLFLPMVIILYFVARDCIKNVLLLLASLIFYAWGEPIYVCVMLFSILVNYGMALSIERSEKNVKKFFLILDIVFNLVLLGYFKYFTFLTDIWNGLTGKKADALNIVLPIGISFFTFQILSYIIDLYRGKYQAQKSIMNLALYISFFPQLIAGPIVKYIDINQQLIQRQCTLEKTGEGIRRFIYRLGKKVIIANIIAYCVDEIFGLDYINLTGVLAWLGAILYSLQIYYDFSGYSDMAIGLGKIFGFEFCENFHYPYMSSSIQEFWKRWHISLGTWFKEYVYIPLGGNRNGGVRTCVNLMIVFGLTGLWHGANFNFIFWGLYHGFFSILERIGLRKVLKKHKVVAHIYTMLIVIIGWVMFRVDSMAQFWEWIKRMINPMKYTESTFILEKVFGNKEKFVFLAGIIGIGVLQTMLEKIGIFEKWKHSSGEIIFCVWVLVLCIIILAADTYNPFIYFRF